MINKQIKSNTMFTDKNIAKVMNSRVLTLHPKDSIQRSNEIFQKYNVHHIPVVVADKVVGIISMGDLMVWQSVKSQCSERVMSNTNNLSISCIEEIMTKNPICIGKDEKLSRALELMIKYRINALPVIHNDKIVGIVTSYDFLKLLQNEIK